MRHPALAAAVLAASGIACGGGGTSTGAATPPPLAPLPAVPVPADNPITPAKVELGKMLFFETRLSADASTSCASCHDPRLGWGDTNPMPKGYPGTGQWRNAPTIVNAAYQQAIFWDASGESLEFQVNAALGNPVDLNADPVMTEERLAQIPEYVARFKEVFGDARPKFEHIAPAIAAFERSAAIARNSPLDRHLAGEADALSPAATRGLALFQGKARCIQCHHGPMLSDQQLHRMGVPASPLFARDAMHGITVNLQHANTKIPPPTYGQAPDDLGHFYKTQDPADRGRFRTAPLRYVGHTAPYMHNGVFETLEEVVDFYDRGGGEVADKDARLQRLGLTDAEKADLLAFLDACTGPRLIVAPPVLPPYTPTRD